MDALILVFPADEVSFQIGYVDPGVGFRAVAVPVVVVFDVTWSPGFLARCRWIR